MGGCGSGRRRESDYSYVESRHPLDIRLLHRRGWLPEGESMIISWRDDEGQERVRITVTKVGDRVVVDYYGRSHAGEPLRRRIDVLRVTRTPCHYGGSRSWWQCECGSRAAILYSGPRGFRCRRCSRLRYRVINEAPLYRSIRRARKLRRRFGMTMNLFDYMPPVKPRFMHLSTFWRLEGQLVAAEMRLNHESLMFLPDRNRKSVLAFLQLVDAARKNEPVDGNR